ncbi:helix-turn-helix domain-containing protein [Sporofaciens sp. SGI.106]|uniref:helix-turn-helix domain-containing protein n=1 Tax=Sporofaciens sp. SGI.106 TaxID=3420568 RepID=UPI002A9F47BA|nr:helix-turn-helix transcriptional regulator [Lachnoclostridium sp.]
MEFHEKLQELRKNRGLTQEELAEALFVSRTAISKWESGRGYPSIDSLKEISNYFGVTIDDLLSGDRLLSIAEKENKSNIRNMCDLLFGIVDLLSFTLIVLPLYPNPVDGYVFSVNLFSYTETTSFNRLVYWIMFVALIVIGVVKILLTQLKIEKGHKIMTGSSMGLSILTVLFLAMATEPYAITVAFLLLIIKGVLLLKYIKASN